MSKFDTPEGQEALRKLQACARREHAMGRHNNSVEFVGFCPDCQAAAFPDGELHHVIRVGEMTPALRAFLATSFAKKPMLDDTQRFETLDADGMVIHGFEYDDGWYVMAQEIPRGRAQAGCGFASYKRATVAFEANDPYEPEGTWIVECEGEVEYVQASQLRTLSLTLR